MKNTPLIFSILIFVGLILSACVPGGGSLSLTDTSWSLVSYGSASDPTPTVPNHETTLTFGADRQVSGNLGCNSFGGSYELKGDQITFGPIMSTLMACLDNGIMEQESAAFNVLRETVTASLEGSTLTLTGPDGSVLILVKK